MLENIRNTLGMSPQTPLGSEQAAEKGATTRNSLRLALMWLRAFELEPGVVQCFFRRPRRVARSFCVTRNESERGALNRMDRKGRNGKSVGAQKVRISGKKKLCGHLIL